MTTVLENIQARLYAINQAITGVRAFEYFDTNIEQNPPTLVPLMEAMTSNPAALGAQTNVETRTWLLVLLLGDWNQALPTKSVQRSMLQLTPLVREAYLSRPRLELSGSPLDSVQSVKLGSDTGLISFFNSAAVQIPLLITYRNSYTYNGG